MWEKRTKALRQASGLQMHFSEQSYLVLRINESQTSVIEV